MNTSHVSNMYMHKIGVETACRVTKTVQLLGDLHQTPFLGTGDCSWQATKCCTPGLCQCLPSPNSLILLSNLRRVRMQPFMLYKLGTSDLHKPLMAPKGLACVEMPSRNHSLCTSVAYPFMIQIQHRSRTRVPRCQIW